MATEVTQKELAAAIKRTPRQVHNLTNEGVFKKNAGGKYPWPDSLHAWIDHRLQLEKRKHEDRDLEEAELRKALADASLKEMKLAEARDEVVTQPTHKKEMSRMLLAVVQILDTFPAKHAPRLPGDTPLPERVAALRRVSREVREELRKAGHDVEAFDALLAFAPRLRQMTTVLAGIGDALSPEYREMLFELANRLEAVVPNPAPPGETAA